MKLNVQYIHLSKIKPDYSIKLTNHVKMLKNRMWDSMHMLVVKKDKKNEFSIISGNDRYEYLKKHTKTNYALCMIDEHPTKTGIKNWLQRMKGIKKKEQEKNESKVSQTTLSIIKCFVKEEPRYHDLSLSKRLKVLLLAVRYKKTVIGSMKAKVDDLINNN
ncbi:hypothetical protein [Fictibacillus phosphorivorans]|uniref:hypothetical protein n=1 Tax=Fictibacillus phosphorivorans TaxID=1221500 RepID=UPI0012940C84|nr:hypothetical protein [Fictibacillus phosphorivorans]MQR97352.1 hypothetical protein [Fictibacillus phosphorivorans]